MSNYSSDPTLDHLWNGPYRIDVADSCMGEDVRILLDGKSAYLEPDEARLVAAALIRAAEATEKWAAMWGGDDAEKCHCGGELAYGFDGDPTHHRGMCAHCDPVRCDAYPGECGRR